jgi:hypothetical protein
MGDRGGQLGHHRGQKLICMLYVIQVGHRAREVGRTYFFKALPPCSEREISKSLGCGQWWNLVDPPVKRVEQAKQPVNALSRQELGL